MLIEENNENNESDEYREGCFYCVLKGDALEHVLRIYGNDLEVLTQMAKARGMPELLAKWRN